MGNNQHKSLGKAAARLSSNSSVQIDIVALVEFYGIFHFTADGIPPTWKGALRSFSSPHHGKGTYSTKVKVVSQIFRGIPTFLFLAEAGLATSYVRAHNKV